MNILIQQPFTIIIELIAITAFILILDRSFCFGNICFKSYCVKRLVEDFFFFFCSVLIPMTVMDTHVIGVNLPAMSVATLA